MHNWTKNYLELQRFIYSNQKYPSNASLNSDERKLWSWTEEQKRKSLSTEWDFYQIALQEFLRKRKRLPRANSRYEKERRLGKWYRIYQYDYLNIDQYNKLTSLPGWIWQYCPENEWRWNIDYILLQDFIKETGRFPLSCSGNIEEEEMGKWVDEQRCRYYNFSGYIPLTEDDIKKLSSIEGWSWEFGNGWNILYEKVRKYILQNGEYPTLNTNKKLWVWIEKQRTSKNLSNERITSLQKLERWSWDPLGWDNSYYTIKKYLDENNGTYPKTKISLSWILNQKLRKAGIEGASLSESQIKKLECIQGWSWEIDEWIKSYYTLKNYIKVNNQYPDMDTELGKWITSQRELNRQSKLSIRYKRNLELMKGWQW